MGSSCLKACIIYAVEDGHIAMPEMNTRCRVGVRVTCARFMGWQYKQIIVAAYHMFATAVLEVVRKWRSDRI